MKTEETETSEKRVLLFNREPETIDLFRSVLDDLGIVLVSVQDRNSGIAELSSGKPDMILADVEFPGLPGLALLDEITRKNLAIPVVILSPDPDDLLKAFRGGAVDFFSKPLNRAEITSRIPDIIERKQRISVLSDSDNNKNLIKRLTRENKELNDLQKISSSLDVSGDSKEILQRLTNLASDSMNCEAASIMLKNDREKILEFVVATGKKGGRLETLSVPIGEGIAGWVARYGKPQVVNDTSKDERFTGKVDEESGFITKQILAVPMYLEGEIIGILEVINTIDERELGDEDIRILTDITDRAALVIGTTKKIESQHNFYIQIINILVKAIEKKDLYGEGHSWMVTELCHKIGMGMNLSENEMNDLYFGALLHDIGKLEIPGILLNKRNLSEREKDFLKQHPVKGAKLIEQILIWKSAVPCILYHHENWNGSGYPFGRSGESIPLLARIINIAEAFTVMRSTNSYKRQLTLKEAILEIMRGAGRQFDPEIVKTLIKVLEQESTLR